ncbi:DUF4291 domain-containing protein [Micromonospora sp. NPDC049048]|uniref:DUF4291 domain-containing protein n=1 Tax=Micromonospora sp. NPDC049048 TaxID=3364263 RepID=UPI003719BC92
MPVPLHQVRARHTADTVTVYQAYPPEIAHPALAAGRFVPPFKRERMTWIKPSFRWMMYRCGWAAKPGQERVLAVEITRAGFEWALANSCPSSFDRDLHPDRETWSRRLRASPVRVQWDPERSLRLAPLPHRSLQVGLSGEAVRRYVDEWLVGLTDVTPTAHAVRAALDAGDDAAAEALLPPERPYPLPPDVAAVIGATVRP